MPYSATPTVPIPIGGQRNERNNSDGTNPDDMSFPGSPLLGISFIEGPHHEDRTSSTADSNILSMDSFNVATSSTHSDEHAGENPANPDEPSTPKKVMAIEKDVELLPGEEITVVNGDSFVCSIDGGSLMMTNYRLIFISDTSPRSISVFPVMENETIDLYGNKVQISLKGGKITRFNFKTSEESNAWHRELTKIHTRFNTGHSVIKTGVNTKFSSSTTEEDNAVTDVFAWTFAEAIKDTNPSWLLPEDSLVEDLTDEDFERLEMEDAGFRISEINKDYKLCPTYPERLIVPEKVTDEDIKLMAPFRAISRVPTVVWRSVTNRAVLLRSSQPQIGILSWRNSFDEKLFTYIKEGNKIGGVDPKQFIIADCRSYTTALANRARSGGFENTENYLQGKIEFCNLPNIHSVRSSFNSMRTLLNNMPNNETLLSSLQNTGWLFNMSILLNSASMCANYLSNGHTVLVHCSDGWDRTAQVVSLTKLMIDEHYRTIEGFQSLIRREWLDFGHKFYDRQQNTSLWDSGERSPIFLQFLEAVRHLQREQPTAFEFTHAYLIKLAQHAYSGLFGTFLFNSRKQRQATIDFRNLAPVEIWRFLGRHNPEFVNQSVDETYKGQLKSMNFSVLNLRVWHEVFADDEQAYRNLYATQSTTTEGNQSPSSQASSPREPPNNGIVERSSSGCGTPVSSPPATMMKSRSSDSIQSINTDGNTSFSSLQQHHHQQQKLVQKERNQNPGEEHLENDEGAEPIDIPGTSNQSNYNLGSLSDYNISIMSGVTPPASVNSSRRSVRYVLDRDGLVKHQDDEQEILRKKNELLMQRAAEQSRRSMSGYPGGQSVSNMNLANDSDDLSLGYARSDMSIIQLDAVSPSMEAKPANDADSGSNPCHICKKELKKITIHSDKRRHTCKNCNQTVCASCSTHEYHVPEEGKDKYKRACDKCYEEMVQQSNSSSQGRSDGVMSRTSSLVDLSSCESPCSSPSSISLNTSPTQPLPIHSSSCKSSSNSIGSPHPSSGEFSRHGSSQAVKG